MRYAEIQRLYNHPEWYSESRNQIRLNEEAQKKAKRKAKERTIDLLPSTLPYILDQFLTNLLLLILIPRIRTLKDGQLKLILIHLGSQLKPQEKALIVDVSCRGTAF